MDRHLRDVRFCRCYIDDIIIWSCNQEEHLKHPKEVFKRLRKAGLMVHPGKCLLASDNIDFLGHHISANSLKPQEDKLSTMRELLAPTDVSSLRADLGLFS